MLVPRAFVALLCVGAVLADMMTVWIPGGRQGKHYDYQALEGSLIHRNDSATTVTLNCVYSRTESPCSYIEGVTFTFGSTTAGYYFSRNSTVYNEYRATAESQNCKVRNQTPYDCDGAWTDYAGTSTTTGKWQLEFTYSTYYTDSADITGYSSSRPPAITTRSKTTNADHSLPTSTGEPAVVEDNNSIKETSGPGSGVIAGAVVGSVAGVALIGLAVVLLVRRRQPTASLKAPLVERAETNLPTYESSQSGPIVHVGSDVGPSPPTYEAALEGGAVATR